MASIEDLPSPDQIKAGSSQPSIDDLPSPENARAIAERASAGMIGDAASRMAQPESWTTAAKSMANEATLNHYPEIEAGVIRGGQKLGLVDGDEDIHTIAERRRKLMEQQKADSPVASAIGSGAGMLTDMYAMGKVPVPAAVSEFFSPTAAKEGASLLNKLKVGASNTGKASLAGAGTGAAIGAAYNPPGHENDELGSNLEARLKGGELGATVGAALPVVAATGGAAIGALSNPLSNFAETRAIRSLHPRERDVTTMYNGSGMTPQTVGRELLDSGAIGYRPVGTEKLFSRISEKKGEAGDLLDGIVSQLETSGKLTPASRNKIADDLEGKLLVNSELPGTSERNARMRSKIDEFRNKGRDEFTVRPAVEMTEIKGYKPVSEPSDATPVTDVKMIDKNLPGYQGVKRDGFDDAGRALRNRDQAVKEIERSNISSLNDAGANPYDSGEQINLKPAYGKKVELEPAVKATSLNNDIGIRDLRKLKKDAADQVNWGRRLWDDIPEDEQVFRGFNKAAIGEEGRVLDDAASKGLIDNVDQYEAGKKRFGALSTAEDVAEKSFKRELGHRTIGMSDMQAGGTGAIVGTGIGHASGIPGAAKIGGTIGGITGGAINKLGRSYGSQVLAKYSDQLSKLAATAPKVAQAIIDNPQMAPIFFDKMMSGEKDTDKGPGVSEEMLGKFRDNPGLIDTISNPQLKVQIQKALERSPSTVVTPQTNEESRQKFQEGN